MFSADRCKRIVTLLKCLGKGSLQEMQCFLCIKTFLFEQCSLESNHVNHIQKVDVIAGSFQQVLNVCFSAAQMYVSTNPLLCYQRRLISVKSSLIRQNFLVLRPQFCIAFGRIRRFATSDYQLCHVCPSTCLFVCPSVRLSIRPYAWNISASTDGFLCNMWKCIYSLRWTKFYFPSSNLSLVIATRLKVNGNFRIAGI